MVTPARRQYLSIKEQHPDALLLYQIGDFYETFDEDARVLARAIEVTLTSKEFGRDGRVPLAGIPVRALDAYLRKLVARGHRVAVCEQVSEAGHGLVERMVTRIVTPGTLAEPQLLRERENNYLAALLAAPGGDSTALAYVGRGAIARFTAHFDWQVFGFTAVLSIATGVLFGLAPALAAMRAEIADGVKGGALIGKFR